MEKSYAVAILAGAPVIVIPEADGGKCLIIDYRTLNKVTQN